MDSLEPKDNSPVNSREGGVDVSSDIDRQIERAKTLVSEIDALYHRLRSIRKESIIVGVAGFRKAVQCELSALKKLSLRAESESTTHMSRSSNLKFWEEVWSTAKTSNDLVAIRKRICWNDRAVSGISEERRTNSTKRQSLEQTKGLSEKPVVVDVVADGGRTWTKVSMATSNSLLFDLAKLGWISSGSDTLSDDDNVHSNNDTDEDCSVPLCKSVKLLVEASKSFRIRGEHPTVQLVLPRITRGDSLEVDSILRDCEECGAVVLCKGDIVQQMTFETSLNAMARDPISDFTATLNLDCTILIALLSDISHMRVDNKPSFHPDIQRQIQSEKQENLLPSLLYPALGNRKLVCTKGAAECMQRIIDNTGTLTEKQRTAIFMGHDSSKINPELVEELQHHSIHAVPSNLQLPILVVEKDQACLKSRLPRSAKETGDALSPINKSIFMYGWEAGLTTITSNRRIVKQIESSLEQCGGVREWPSIWLCPLARSLLGEEQCSTTKTDEGERDTT